MRSVELRSSEDGTFRSLDAAEQTVQLVIPNLEPGPPGASAEEKEKRMERKRLSKDDIVITEDIIGLGGYGKVLLAKQKGTDTEYAAKIVSKDQMVRYNRTHHVMRERNLLLKLRHPNVIKLFFTYQDSQDLFFILEYASKGDLGQYLSQVGPLPYGLARVVVSELVNGLEYIHQNKIIHRDLKPENILLDRHMHVKIADFGTALESNVEPSPLTPVEPGQDFGDDTDDEFVDDRSFNGTAQYASPELLINCTTTYASDLWALGCIVYQLLTGKRAFQGNGDYMTFSCILEGKIEYPSDFPKEARSLCEQLLVLNPVNRLGVGIDGYKKLKSHDFFAGIDFESLKDQIHDFPEYHRCLSNNSLPVKATSSAMRESPIQPSGDLVTENMRQRLLLGKEKELPFFGCFKVSLKVFFRRRRRCGLCGKFKVKYTRIKKSIRICDQCKAKLNQIIYNSANNTYSGNDKKSPTGPCASIRSY